MKATLALLLLLTAPWAFGAGETLERYALVTGSNLGGRGTAPLKYASGDAKRFQDVLNRLGGLKEENSLLLVNPGKESMLQGMAFLRSKIKKNRVAGRQVQFIFYYSGHSDEQGLLLGGERWTYNELKSELDLTAAEVQIVVLDSCASGAFTRTKGGQIGAPFLKDLSTQIEGHAFLTSSTAEELSQESDRIESSFFTHALVEGLRGAADANGDGKVTLNEAYEYAYSQTTADTQATTSGTQHPAYDIQLNGKGNLVMTDLRTGGATLVFPKEMSGKVTVRDIGNKLLAEVQKSPLQELTLGIEQGYYKISWEDRGTLTESTALVDEPRAYPVQLNLFQAVGKAPNRTRGTEGGVVGYVPWGMTVSDQDGFQLSNFNLIAGQVTQFDGMMVSLVYNRTVQSSSGFQGALFANAANSDFSGVQATFGVNTVGGDFSGLQNSWILNDVAGRLSGMQIGPVNHVRDTLNLGQFGGVNVLGGDGRYFQIGVWNQAGGGFIGLQLGSLFNYAKNLSGVQIGLINYSEEQTGVQIGLINVSKKLIGLPIGLIDIQFNGQNHLDQTFGFTGTSWTDLATTTTLRFGSEYFYKYFSFQTRVAYNGEQEALPALSLGAGIGLRAPLFFPGFALHLDAGTSYQRSENVFDFRPDEAAYQRFVPQFRTFASWSFYQNYGLLVGWDHPVYTEYFHTDFSTQGKTEIKTNWGNLFMGNRFFLGVQL